jgi:tricorn protease-like protein
MSFRLAAVLATLGASALLATPAMATFPGNGNGRVAYSGLHDGKTGIFTVKADGTDTQLLIAGNVFDPAWAPHGEQIAWENWGQIGLVRTDGTGWTMLTDRSEIDFAQDPAWSPDGTKIAFAGQNWGDYYYGSSADIYVVDVDGTDVHKVTDTPNDWESEPAWSPDGTRIAFTSPTWSSTSYSNDIYTVKPDGSDRKNLTKGGFNRSPNWSPDGARLVFARSGFGGAGVVSTIAADGTDYRDLFQVGETPVYSPDGTQILFNRALPYPAFTNALVTMPVDGGTLRSLTAAADFANQPDWQALQVAPDYTSPLPVLGTLETAPPDATAALKAYVSALLGKVRGALRKAGLGDLARGVVLTQAVPSAGTLQIDLLGTTARASAAAKKKRLKVLATGRATAKKAGKLKVRVRATKAGRKAIKKAKRVRLTLRVSFKAKGSPKITRSTKITLKRKK